MKDGRGSFFSNIKRSGSLNFVHMIILFFNQNYLINKLEMYEIL